MATSSNPFRKKSSLPEEDRFPPLEAIDTSQTYAPPPRTSFPEAELFDNASDNDDDRYAKEDMPEPPPKNKKNKVVKKVRVVSPPPLSPDSPEWPSTTPPNMGYGDMQQSDPFSLPQGSIWGPDAALINSPTQQSYDSLQQNPTQATTQAAAPPPPPPQRSSASGVPANPFSKTLQDIENSTELELQKREEGEALKAANTSKPSLDVNAFKRLLLTGKADTQDTPSTSGTPVDRSIANIKADDTVHPVTESTPQKEKKTPPPPPPSSRRGGSTKAETKTDVEAPTKMAPEPPARTTSEDNSSASSSDEESASDPSSQTPPQLQQPSDSAKKPVPAPPPRRGHGRSESKANAPLASTLGVESSLRPSDDDTPSRSSMESIPSRPEPTRSGPKLPAPPPPRRPHAAPKQTPGIAPSPSISSISIPQTDISTPANDTPSKSSKVPAPPPPPARHASSRRPPSIQGVEAPTPRKSSTEGSKPGAPPPPPARRMRGNSNSKADEPTNSIDEKSVDPGLSADILADLDALRREVDALRGKVE